MINKGEPINPKKLENLIVSKFNSIFTTLSRLIPIGFNSLYNVIEEKTFSIRPKVINPIYSTRSGSDENAISADITQPNIGSSYLGTPWTASLGQRFGVDQYTNINKGSTQEPYDKIVPKVPYNPTTDLFGGVPLRGNAPLLHRGFVGLSNWFEDSNIRAYVDESGGTFTLKAKQLSMLYPYREIITSDDYDEYVYKKGIALSQPIANINKSVNCSGLSEGDYLAFITGTGTYSNNTFTQDDLDIRFKDIDSLSTDYGITWSGDPSFSSYGTAHRYERPLFVVYSNGTGIETSSVTAWEEVIGTNTNSDPKYSKLYQQCTSTDTTTTLQTLDSDRRMIPAYHYFNNNNDKLISNITYSGIIKDIPGAGGNKVTIDAPIWSASSPLLNISVAQCELTNGTRSLWIRDLNLSGDDIYYQNGSPSDPYQQRGLYIWLVANIKDASKGTFGTSISDIPGYSLDTKVVLHSSPTWSSDNHNNSGTTRSTTFWYTSDDVYRCRIGWIPTDPNRTAIPTKIVDGKHMFPTVNRFTGGANNSLKNLTLGTGGTDGTYQPVSLNQCRILPIWGNNGLGSTTTCTSVACTSINMELHNISGTRTTGTSWVGVTTDTISTAAGIDVQTTGAVDQLSGSPWLGASVSGTDSYIYRDTFDMSVGTNDTIYYTGTGADGGSYWNGTLKMALVRGFYLPYSWQ